MPELRKDPVISRWVIVATERAKRPSDFQADEADDPGDPTKCPFCPGHEESTPPEVLAVRPDGSQPNTPGWEIRVTSNKFPALRIEGDLNRRGVGMFDKMNGVGAHEVIIESSDHFKRIHEHPVTYMAKIFGVMKQRIIDLARDKRFEYVLVFKNQGRAAGASLSHSHCQIIATPIVPKRVIEELQGSLEHWNLKKRCIFCDMIDQIEISNELLVHENEKFVAISPFAAMFPFETWIMPKTHHAEFHMLADEDLTYLAAIVKLVLKKWYAALGNLNYNLVLHTLPTHIAVREQFPLGHAHYHWHIEMFPRLTKTAGFEWGTGFYINPTPPEEAAKFLRDLQVDGD
jgi:UDPglucose--hexose-1-phosphate uridylyltransferase